MKDREYDKVCYRAEQREEAVPIRNRETGQVGYAFGCTYEGTTVQVRLENGELDTWEKDVCMEDEG